MRHNAGNDWQGRVMADTASTGTGAYAPANWIGLSATGTAPVAGDTVLAGEVTTGTLARAQGTYAKTTGASSYTLTKTFTSDQTITVRKAGVFNAATGGTMAFSKEVTPEAAMISGDQLALTQTVNF